MMIQASPRIRLRRNGLAYAVDQVYMWPADRCTWQQEASANGNGYTVSNVTYYPGVAVNQAETGDNPATLNETNDGIQLQNAVLGYIGKSGRFVAITDAS